MFHTKENMSNRYDSMKLIQSQKLCQNEFLIAHNSGDHERLAAALDLLPEGYKNSYHELLSMYPYKFTLLTALCKIYLFWFLKAF